MACAFGLLGAQSIGTQDAHLAGVEVHVPLGRRRLQMTNHIFSTLLLSAALALPGFARQTNSTASAPPLSQSTNATHREPLPADTPKDFWDGDDPNFVNLVRHPFASKKS